MFCVQICGIFLIQEEASPKHLLWALMFLKQYNTQSFTASIVDVDEKTYRKWVWKVIKKIADIDFLVSFYFLFFFCIKLTCIQINFDDRNLKGGSKNICRISVDGTDFRIQEPTPFSKKWFSHKFNGPGLRYEVGIGITTGWIVWVNDPFPPGEFNDLKIAKSSLIYFLDDGEKYVADKGYQDGDKKLQLLLDIIISNNIK